MTWQMYFADGRGLCQTQRRSRLWSTAAREPSFMRWEMAHFFYKSHHRGQHWSTIKSSKHLIQKIVNRESFMFLITLTMSSSVKSWLRLQGRLGDTSRDKLFVFQYAENFLFNFGLDGKGCLLRAICETHETPLLGHGMIGEILELFLTWVLREQKINGGDSKIPC